MFSKIFGRLSLTFVLCTFASAVHANHSQEMLVKLAPGTSTLFLASLLGQNDSQIETVADDWVKIQFTSSKSGLMKVLKNDPGVLAIQPNYKLRLLEDYKIQDPLRRKALRRYVAQNWPDDDNTDSPPITDNPALPTLPANVEGIDPLTSHQWGMTDLGVSDAWKVTFGVPEMIVAVIDTGVDYTHEDLLPNIWRNKGEVGVDAQGKEKSTNGVDDDGNGYIDDVIGWDFVTNDNLPYDLSVRPEELLFGGGNPGHGTHCAGNVAARGSNSVGIAGVAPWVDIMPIRFISEKGQGDTAGAIKAIRYAVDNGARILSNSWGSMGEDPNDSESNLALREAVQYAQEKGALFIAAAGNGRMGKGYDNDSASDAVIPASYEYDNIISVAALNNTNQLGEFSNWGVRTVDIGAPGVVVYSTTVGNKYSDQVLDMAGFKVSWDGTSMATPHVAGAAALYWSAHPEKSWSDVKAAILNSSKKIDALNGKVVSNGKLDVRALMQQP